MGTSALSSGQLLPMIQGLSILLTHLYGTGRMGGEGADVTPTLSRTTRFGTRSEVMHRHSTPDTPPVVHPYARISKPEQRKGGGLDRQTKADVDEFARRFGFTLSKRVLVDDGVSAFKGLNASPEHQLGQFLAEARKGLIRPGDCLLVENWDRLSRQDPWAAISLINDLRQCRVHLGRLDRMKLLRYDSTDTGDFFDAALELIRGHSESAAKSMRNGAAWVRKRRAARESGEILTNVLPLWIEERGGKLVLIPERAA